MKSSPPQTTSIHRKDHQRMQQIKIKNPNKIKPVEAKAEK
jgi:hypothetical protein